MRYNKLLKKMALTKEDYADIQTALSDVHKKTSGRISLAVIAESSSYAFWEMLAAFFSTFGLFACLIPLSSQIYSWLGRTFWGEQPWYLAVFLALVCGTLTIALYFFYNIPALDRIIIPQVARRRIVSNRAMRRFAESGIYRAPKGSGILIFVSYLEREVRIVADKGVSEKVSQDLWNLIADEMSEFLARGQEKEAWLHAVKRCGELLAEHYPPSEDDEPASPQGLVVLEDEKWA
ncbi:MAG TPA: hypothetical protein DEO40_03425 [Treponema sp.]|jgi:putative membrane protein|nr:hypothetical protein [Treponema sp.]